MAWLLLLAIAILGIFMKGPMHLIAAIGRGELMPPSDLTEQLKFYPHGQVVFYWLYFTGLWAIKLSFLLFFRRLGNRVRGQKVVWWTVFALAIAFFFTVVAVINYKCLLGLTDIQLGKYPPVII